jgi:hypothetical protein
MFEEGKMNKWRFAVLASLAIVALSTISVRADLLNGGFETMGSSWTNGVTNAPSWTIADASQATGIFNSSYLGLGAHSGNAFLWGGAFNGATATVSQTVTTTAGQYYNLEFFLGNTNGGQAANNNWSVMWNGTTLTSATNASASGYTDYNFLVSGTGHDTLTFVFRNEPGAFGLDDVTLRASAVPISPSLILFASGLGSLFIFRRKRLVC